MRQMIPSDPPPRMEPAPRRDPAPSRLSYRMQRLALTPSIRRLVTVGLPLFAIAASVGVLLADQGRRDMLTLWVADVKATIQQREEFMVKLMAIDGATDGLAEDIREILPIDFPISSFDLDLARMQSEISALDAVADAGLRIRPGGVLQVDITERVPAVIWRTETGLDLLDAKGHRVSALLQRNQRPDLPLIAGAGAQKQVAEALELLEAGAPLKGRMRGLMRVGDRRWDVVLDRGQRILLPEVQPVNALEQVIALDQAQDLLARDVALVDMRSARRPTVRLEAETADVLRKIKLNELGAD